MTEDILIKLAGIGGITLISQWLAWRIKVPAIVFLLLAGVLAGPVTGWINPDQLFGDLLFPVVSLGVAVILFEGSLTLRFHEIKGLEKVVRRFVSTGVIATWFIITIATFYILDFSLQISLLFGAVMVVTGPTVIVPMLRAIRPNQNIANILRWEGIVIDPVGALLAVLVFDFIILDKTGSALSHTFYVFALLVIVGVTFGVLAGYLFGIILRKHWLPEYLHNVATLTIVFCVFALSNTIQEESGLISVTIMGVWLANMKGVHTEDILHFKESLSILLISALFILLAARINFTDIQEIGWAGLLLFCVIQFIARPVKVIISTRKSSLKLQERALLSWIAPRGIVAAAIVSLFAIRLEELQFEGANLLVPLAFMIIIGTVLLQGATAGPLARWLKVAEPEPNGFLIIGGNIVARTIAKALMDNGAQIQLTDSNWNNVQAAREMGLKIYYGSAVSEHADRHLELIGIGRMLGLAQRSDYNNLTSIKYRREFGRNNVYVLPTSEDKSDIKGELATAPEHRGMILFSKDATYAKLASLISKDAEIRATTLSEELNYQTYQEKYAANSISLFAIDQKGKIIPFSEDKTIEAHVNWTIIALFYDDKESEST